jgi:hypothetical protein
MIPARFAPVVFGFILSGLMSCIVSAIATLRAVGLPPDFVVLWMSSWVFAWAVAFPTVLVIAPITRKLVARLTAVAPGLERGRLIPTPPPSMRASQRFGAASSQVRRSRASAQSRIDPARRDQNEGRDWRNADGARRSRDRSHAASRAPRWSP